MFLHLGGETIIPKDEVVAIFDSEIGKNNLTKEFLQLARGEKMVVSLAEKDRIRSIIITRDKVYLSPISSITLKRRSDNFSAYLAEENVPANRG